MIELGPGELVAAKQVLDTAPDAIVVVAASGRIVYANRQAVTLFGRSLDDLTSGHLDALLPARFRGAHAAHLARYFAAPTVRAMGSGIELYGVHRDGHEIPIEVSLSPLREGGDTFVSAALRDVSERRRVQAAIQLGSERLTSAVESVAQGLAFFDADDRLFLCNDAYRRIVARAIAGPILGLRYREVLDAFLDVLDFGSATERAEYRRSRLAERGMPAGPYVVRTIDGCSYRVTQQRTAEGGMVHTVADITSDIQRTEELRRARIAAEAGSAAKSDFLASMSHELRTPLNAVLGFAQLCRRDKKDPLSERHRRRLEQIEKGGEHLLRLIDDVLDLARIESGTVTVLDELVDAHLVAAEVMATLQPAAALARVELRLETGDRVSAIGADRTRFAQILMNYGSNAIKYNGRGKGVVTFVLARVANGRVRVSVRDNGMGVPADKRHTLFQPFQRAGQETGTIEGTGIGLAISKRLAEHMSGSVGYQPLTEGGSEFWVELPPRASIARAASEPARLPADSDLPRLEARGRVLYVEDNQANVVFMQDLLEAIEEVELLVAPTAEIGLELARATKPHAIIMDIDLPGMSGIDALRELQSSPDTADIPVIALTAVASERDRLRGEQAGFHRYLTRPVQVIDLERTLQALLRTDLARS